MSGQCNYFNIYFSMNNYKYNLIQISCHRKLRYTKTNKYVKFID